MAAALEIDTLHGTIGAKVWFHLDLSNYVLYLRDQATRNDQVFGEETPEGFTQLHTELGEVAGMTVVNYWRRFGSGSLMAASIQAIMEQVADWAQSHFVGA